MKMFCNSVMIYRSPHHDAEIYIANGIASTPQLDYRFCQMQFLEFKKTA
jgi:hypothetical protein